MGGKLNVYNLGDLGIDLVGSPIHIPDGALTQAQNAAVSQNQGEHGLKKRLGMAKLNATALNSGAAIVSIGNVPFAAPDGGGGS